MNYNITDFSKELKEFIEKEKKSNKIIKADIVGINKDILKVSTVYNTDLTKNMNIEIDRVPAKIIFIKGKNIQIKILKKSNFSLNQNVSIKNIQKDIIIHKLQETLNNITDNKLNKENKKTLDVIVNDFGISFSDDNFKISSKLNQNQKIAVKKVLQANKFHIIQGPPGSGKTHTITEIIKHLYFSGKRILVTTHTHVALDNIIERLDSIDQKDILRIGRNEKISDKVLKYALDEQIKLHPDYGKIYEKKSLIEQLQNSDLIFENGIINNYKNKNIFNKIFNLLFNIKENKNSQDNSHGSPNNFNNIDEINEIKKEIDDIKNNMQHDIVGGAKIIASTVLSSSSFLTKDIEFDYVIMDESSQVPVYLALIPLLKTNKFVLIGDNKQLQPIKNNNASYLLNKSIFNLLIEKYPNNYTFLNTQYRMNKKISDIASSLYYDNKLLTGDAVKNQKISLKNNKYFLLNEDVITFIDTSDVNFNEVDLAGGCCNKYESCLVLHLVDALLSNDISCEEIGIITPYRKQKNHIIKLLNNKGINIECDTIYRFQGREKDVIIISFCKSLNKSLNDFQKKFLADENQLNVSLTRSRKKLIIIGNYSMLGSAQNIKDLVNEISRENILYLDDIL
ncbi:AAA domain-containing protein [Methanosphaera sp.]|uniref:AAA domain-containing protein n=1 Tax=Methanosphaera sp. TaxID=2666342 RepID=UPI002E79365E|nr:AAA domain-containing protein [Methanosphaera sp.]MEE1117675.1 AAA domain-containing protein [Methanosphaera sp.]